MAAKLRGNAVLNLNSPTTELFAHNCVDFVFEGNGAYSCGHSIHLVRKKIQYSLPYIGNDSR